jgi:catechol 2,3-dioxygenase-like lactoylglutathione lyase family enzyme
LGWDGSVESVTALLGHIGADIIEDPVEREGGRREPATSPYVRDPDGNRVEFIVYDHAPKAPLQ